MTFGEVYLVATNVRRELIVARGRVATRGLSLDVFDGAAAVVAAVADTIIQTYEGRETTMPPPLPPLAPLGSPDPDDTPAAPEVPQPEDTQPSDASPLEVWS